MRVQGPLLVDVVVVMLVGQSQSVLAVHPVVAGDHGVARDLVYRVAVVGVVIHWDRPPGVLTETGGNVGKMKSQFVPEEPVRPVDGGESGRPQDRHHHPLSQEPQSAGGL